MENDPRDLGNQISSFFLAFGKVSNLFLRFIFRVFALFRVRFSIFEFDEIDRF